MTFVMVAFDGFHALGSIFPYGVSQTRLLYDVVELRHVEEIYLSRDHSAHIGIGQK